MSIRLDGLAPSAAFYRAGTGAGLGRWSICGESSFTEMLYLFIFTQLLTQNRDTLLQELL